MLYIFVKESNKFILYHWIVWVFKRFDMPTWYDLSNNKIAIDMSATLKILFRL